MRMERERERGRRATHPRRERERGERREKERREKEREEQVYQRLEKKHRFCLIENLFQQGNLTKKKFF